MPTEPHAITVSLAAPDVAVITFDQPGARVNLLSSSVLAELEGHLRQLAGRTALAGLIIRSGKPGVCIAGADIKELNGLFRGQGPSPRAMCNRGRELFAELARMPFVTVMAISGVCVGGGAELSVWCDRRILSTDPRTQFAFPEVKIGVIPGWGGTVRAPRIIGLSNAVELICSGESIDARRAYELGLSSDLVPEDQLLDAAIRLIRAEQESGDWQRDRQRWAGSLDISDEELAFLEAASRGYLHQQTKGQYPAPVAALEVMIRGARLPADAAGRLEAETFEKVAATPAARSLVHVFFLNDRLKNSKGLETEGVTPRTFRTAGVLGAGLMGAGIAAANIKRGLPTQFTDANADALRKGIATAIETAAYSKDKSGPDPAKALALVPLLRAAARLEDFAEADLVIEAVVENEAVKTDLLRRVEKHLKPDAILASNTSTISISKLAGGLADPARFCGIHFFSPVHRMQLVEVIRGRQTADETVATAVAHAKSLGKLPVVVQDSPGFLVNRLLFPYLTEALEVLLEGAGITQVDRAIRAFGMPMGPLTLYDAVGIDTACYAGSVMHAAFPDRMADSALLAAMLQAGRLGQKSGKGFYLYQSGSLKGIEDPELETLLARLRNGHRKFTDDEIVARLMLPMVLEATRVLDEAIVRSPMDIDAGMVLGTGFPPFRGGVCFWADTVGANSILSQLEPLARQHRRFQPTPMLEQMAATGQGFYGRQAAPQPVQEVASR